MIGPSGDLKTTAPTESRNVLLLGHRGARASKHIPENTLASFELCLQHGCDGFEFDVRRSADGEAVICHDETWRGMKIAKHAARDLGLPTFNEVLERFSSRAFLDIELKVPGLEEQTLAALRLYSPGKGYLVSSFRPLVLHAIHALDTTVPLGWLCERDARADVVPEAEWVLPRVDCITQEVIEDLHTSGKKVIAWTVNHVVEMRRLMAWGIDGVISDETELLIQTAGHPDH